MTQYESFLPRIAEDDWTYYTIDATAELFIDELKGGEYVLEFWSRAQERGPTENAPWQDRLVKRFRLTDSTQTTLEYHMLPAKRR